MFKFNFFKRKSKDNKIETEFRISSEFEVRQCEEWMKELGVSKSYTKFKPFEDPNLVKDALSVAKQLKIERIRECQRQYEDSKY